MQILIIVGIVSAVIGLYVITMALNNKVQVPESCKEAYLEAQTCESCSSRGTGCGFSAALEFMKEVKPE